MPLYAFSLVAMGAIALWVAVQHGLMAWRQRDQAQQAFALLAAAVALKCALRLALHLTDDLEQMQRIDRMCWLVLLAEAWLLIDFVRRFTGHAARVFTRLVGALLLFMAAWLFLAPYGFFSSPVRGIITEPLSWGERISILDVDYGLGYWILVTTATLCLVGSGVMGWRAWRRSGQHRYLALIASLVAIAVCIGWNIVADHLQITCVPLIEHGFAVLAAVMGAVLAHQAVQATRLEQRLHRQERLAAIGQLAGGVAHDFGNILTGVIGTAELLELELTGKQRELIQALAGSGRRGLALVRQLTAFASGRSAAVERVDLHTVVREVANLVQTGRGRNLALDLNLEAVLSVVDGDPAQVHSLILNLMLNARDAVLPGSGRVVVETGLGPPAPGLQLRHRPHGERLLWLSVADNGPGIPPAILPHVFDPFFSTKGEGGSGLGLAQVDSALTALGGALAVESTLGRGTRFRVWLPLADDTSAERPAAGTRVLVVSSDASLRELICQTLAALGYEATTAGILPSSGTFAAVIADGGDVALLAQRFPTTALVLLGDAPSSAPGRITITRPVHPRSLVAALREALLARRHPR